MLFNTLPIHPTLTDPRTGLPLRALGFTSRGPVWPVAGGAPEEGEGGAPAAAGGTPPAAPPAADAGRSDDWKPPASQADLDRIIEQRLARERARFADYDAVKEKATRFEALEAASRTDTERAVAEAQEAAWQAAMAQTVPRVVAAEFRAQAAATGLDSDKLDAILEDLDMLKYANDDGEPDVERIRNKITPFAPAAPEPRRGPTPFGSGRRESAATGQSVAAGRELYRSRHPQKTP